MARPAKQKRDLKGVQQSKDGRYKVDVVRVLPDGGRFRRTTNCKELEDALAFRDTALAEYRAIAEGAQTIADGNQTLREWADHCLNVIMPAQANRRGKPYADNTLRGYRQLLDAYVKPSIGYVKLSKLSVDHVDALVASLPSEPLKINTKNCLSRLLDLAEAKGKRAKGSNPCKGVVIGRTKHKRTDAQTVITTKVNTTGQTGPGARYRVEHTPVPAGLMIETKRVLSFEEEETLLGHVRNHPSHSEYETLVLLGLRAGLRIAESLGLDWHHIDFARNVIRIDQQAQRITGKGVQVVNPKSSAGFREIPMTPSLHQHLAGVKLFSTSPHVIHNSRGGRRDAARAAGTFKKLTEQCGLGDKVEGNRFLPRPTFHDLRRTCLTRLATGRVAKDVTATPVPPTVLIRISGHEDQQTLLSFYTVADDKDVVSAMATMP